MLDILNSKTLYGHLILRMFAILFFTGLMIYLVIPLIFWSVFGEGASSDQVGELPISKLIEIWGPLFLAILILEFWTRKNVKKQNFSKAKSYIFARLLLIIIYPFRIFILDGIINVCLNISDKL